MPLKTHFDDQPTLNMTPMIDIVFLLVIFFMVGTKFTELEHNLELEVPAVASADTLTAAPKKRIINVFRDGHIELDDAEVTTEVLREKLEAAKANYPDVGVIVRGDGKGEFEKVAGVLGVVREAGIAEMAISVRIANQRR
ncbi:MAG: biopolymer transporter ExbD [bacterium]|nr:biopolymer transporter ExbD [bacterium]